MPSGLRRLSVSFAILLILSPVNQSHTAAQTTRLTYPAAKRVEQVDMYHGVAVSDPYRWLEQMDSDETKVWARAQEGLLQSYLSDATTRAAIKARLTELVQTDSYSVPRKASGRYFYIFTAAGRPRGQGVIYVQEDLRSDPAEFKTLLASSPYHNVKSGQCYPPTLVMAGELDQTAVPAHAWKFTAAMQAAQGCDNAVLLKTMKGAGHNYGGTAEQTVDSYTDELMFLTRTLRLSPALVARQ